MFSEFFCYLCFKAPGLQCLSQHFPTLQGLDGMELILFTAAHLVPCFGFVPKTVLTSKCFSYCRALLAPCFSLCALSKKAGRGQEARMGQLTPADPKGIPCHRTSHLAMKGREGGDSNVVAQELPEIPLAGGRW